MKRLSLVKEGSLHIKEEDIVEPCNIDGNICVVDSNSFKHKAYFLPSKDKHGNKIEYITGKDETGMSILVAVRKHSTINWI